MNQRPQFAAVSKGPSHGQSTQLRYEIPLNRRFYVFPPPRPLSVIDAEWKGVTDCILTMIGGITK